MPYLISRRCFIAGSLAFGLCALFARRSCAQSADPFIGPFDKKATAELVTEGIDLRGKTIVITGANSGLGYEAMRVLALRGAHVIAVARTMESAKNACAGIQGMTTPAACELSDFSSVVACSNFIQQLNLPLDALICNAGIMELPELEQVNGMEKQFVVNHLGHFILTSRLLDRVKEATQGRVVILSSGRYKNAPAEGIQFDNLSGEKDYDPLTAYGQSKLANALFAQELSRRVQGTAVTVNSVLPGVINTNLGRHLPRWKQLMAGAIGWTFMRSVEEGAATSCYVATHPQLATVTGHMFSNCNPITPEGPHMSDRALARRLWDVSVEMTKDFL